ncbi:hypothetical protein M2167_000370 [Streptomyces sp. SPB4]|nr:hypothetical protein [Streptomyces sp. SPB4]
MVLQHGEPEGLQCLGGGADLGEDVGVLGILLDQALQAADLTLDAAQPLEGIVLVGRLTVHGDPFPTSKQLPLGDPRSR